ncbi:hypothetical protein [Alloyangia pacifica]|uniref:Uncharacterized protein n=1 Tax=Alloyangia pacifica TaxID=311180 RepID=A0A1I6PP95_9RHOB|nr:hypothetical protein [Alloyangia pacifica]SDG32599.1 hypothetical protein SAMN04488245_102377 [Alloyangia pacifica]SFS42027.1 hypothetical protein SAMN04488050_101678 [Alloyangia pacifica]
MITNKERKIAYDHLGRSFDVAPRDKAELWASLLKAARILRHRHPAYGYLHVVWESTLLPETADLDDLQRLKVMSGFTSLTLHQLQAVGKACFYVLRDELDARKITGS